jgi:hypothetical protein
MKKSLCLLALLLLTAVVPAAVRAETPGEHPRYMHALSALRVARIHIERRGGDPKMKWDEQTAIAEIDLAIRELKTAAIDDGKNPDFRPPVDANLNHGGRLHHALDLLRAAHKDIREHEDNVFAHGLRDRVLRHIDAAAHFVEQGIAEGHY